jgi:hypothetical protein
MDKSGANKAAIDKIHANREIAIMVRRVKYLNSLVEQDHRAVKRITRPMLSFPSFQTAKHVSAGIKLMHLIRKGQFMIVGGDQMFFADQFYALARSGRINPPPFNGRYIRSTLVQTIFSYLTFNATEPHSRPSVWIGFR